MNSQTDASTTKDDKSRSNNAQLVDRFGRPVDYLRISVTQDCNHQCFFCHREGEKNPAGSMTPAEIEKLVRLAVAQGIKRVKITGGEALLRPDIVEIVRRLSPLVSDLSLTTNGSRLATLAKSLRLAGLHRVNVSLHTLRRERHKRITGVADIEEVKHGIETAIRVGLSPLKVNMTILKGYNEDEIFEMMEYAGRIGAILQLIELQPMPDDNPLMEQLRVDLSSIEGWLRENALQSTRRSLHGRVQYTVPNNGGIVKVEVVRPVHNNIFCAQCTRLRVTSDGKLKPCLLRNDNLVDVHDLLKPESAEKDLLCALKSATNLREPFWRGDEK